jgi:hypothetical protein
MRDAVSECGGISWGIPGLGILHETSGEFQALWEVSKRLTGPGTAARDKYFCVNRENNPSRPVTRNIFYTVLKAYLKKSKHSDRYLHLFI